MNSIWEKNSSNDVGVNGVLFKYLSVYQFEDMINISKMFQVSNCDSSTSPVLPSLFALIAHTGEARAKPGKLQTIWFLPSIAVPATHDQISLKSLELFFPR